MGSSLIGQTFTGDKWFQGRFDTDDPTATAPSNLGPSNPALNKEATTNAAAVRKANDLAPNVPLPIDAVTSSGSSLDPDISPAYARLQAPRVATANGCRWTPCCSSSATRRPGARSASWASLV